MLLAAFLAAMVGSASAQPGVPCTRQTAQPAAIRAIMTDPAGYRGRCVAVTAFSHGLMLYSSVEGYYLAGPLTGIDPAREPEARERLGMENRRVMRRIPRGGLRRVTAFGRVQICEELREMIEGSAGPNEIVMLLGFCHMFNGPFLALDDVSVAPGSSPARLSGEANRARIGNLVAPPADWPHRAFVEAHARQYLAALRSGDRAAFARLHEPDQQPGAEASEAVAMAFGRHRGFRDIRTAPQPPQMVIFIQDAPGPGIWSAEDRDDDYASTVCFCRSGDCADRWPISTFDADNREDRPYVCASFVNYVVFNGGTAPTFRTRGQPFGLPEPHGNNSTR
jgi:hypothetical protein